LPYLKFSGASLALTNKILFDLRLPLFRPEGLRHLVLISIFRLSGREERAKQAKGKYSFYFFAYFLPLVKQQEAAGGYTPVVN